MVVGFFRFVAIAATLMFPDYPTELFAAFKHTGTEGDDRPNAADGEAYTNGDYYQYPENRVPPLRADGFLNVNFHIAKLLK
jgi:hypothetical protein